MTRKPQSDISPASRYSRTVPPDVPRCQVRGCPYMWPHSSGPYMRRSKGSGPVQSLADIWRIRRYFPPAEGANTPGIELRARHRMQRQQDLNTPTAPVLPVDIQMPRRSERSDLWRPFPRCRLGAINQVGFANPNNYLHTPRPYDMRGDQ